MAQTLEIAEWSSPVARQAHNLKVVGSNPTSATNSATRAENRASSAPAAVSVTTAYRVNPAPEKGGAFSAQILALNRKSPHVCQGDADNFARRHNLKVKPLV